MTRAVFFDVDGVLVHGMHARPELSRRWDTALLADMGVDPERFTQEFIFGVFIKKVIVGKMSVIEALERHLPSLGYKGSPMVFHHYWLMQDSVLNQPLLDHIRVLRAQPDIRLFIATNQEHLRATWLWSHLGLSELFDDIFYSARAGIRKPEKGFFDFIDQRIGPQAEPPLFFDDTPKVIQGASAHGWEAVLFETLEDCTTHPWIAARL
ncbi:HAD-IA family hydrolase [Devosia ginsengisoli]|uniref:HAD-IA family hydrolase n=1 Tax=Devosia ginsengisoli TaxID=400770 RepID=A0A5B8LR70_9HYPH|nr:HAD-IA family hydrolase [Devosia ginsengisoli]QDZ10738.1 HAD-IA family hydrolase [Devosia ginsengisoli]